MWRILGNILCDLLGSRSYDIMYFLVNSSPKPLDVATSNFAGAYM